MSIWERQVLRLAIIFYIVLLLSALFTHCRAHEIKDILGAMAYQESSCGKFKLGDDGKSLGLFQIQISTAKWVGVNTAPAALIENNWINTAIALILLDKNRAYFKGDIWKAVAAHNMGRKGVKKTLERKPIEEFEYIKQIKKRLSKGQICPLNKLF